ncbi:hypothetical protein Z517_12551 [Fonsecaea pedrosoi CBS 271.37]|uniref:Amino acid permease/ SLC12A domain-containing protein n=1 Tax=Fonsecaea pedrosoi CBS 271.37 TaxID=1442368 RepID=A0A0D2D988_9EURO|nr:uncharacterized protein Z517_12551 [Fonsecaea pedrosoi CBS 271.37]KIW74141.1 hypothetical protein Z517_12551 [Fonsecaea pedrosoi CBS 271.37]
MAHIAPLHSLNKTIALAQIELHITDTKLNCRSPHEDPPSFSPYSAPMSSPQSGVDVEIHGSKPVVERVTADDQLAHEFGYKPVFVRKYGTWSSLSFAFSVGGLFTALMTTFAYPLQAGGPAAILRYPSSSLRIRPLLEFTTQYPVYHLQSWSLFLAGKLTPFQCITKTHADLSCRIAAWLNVLGQVAAVAATEFGASQVLLSAVAVGSDFTFEPSQRATVGVAAGLAVLTGVINSVSTTWMEKMQKTFVVFHVTAVVVCFITLLAVEKSKNSASFVFTNVQSQSGWNPTGFAFLFGFLSAAFTMTNYDATAHICEEIRDPAIAAPRATWYANVMTFVLGLVLNIVLCFCMKDPYTVLANKIGQPVVQIFYDSLGKSGALAFTACGVIIVQFTAIVCMQSLSRTIFAFSRDRLLPFSSIWAKVNTLTGIPLHAVWLSVLLPIVISLIGLGSYQAVSAVFNVATAVLDLSYAVPLGCKLAFGRFHRGPWHLGAFSVLINVYSIVWTFFITVLFFMPTVRPVTAVNMNYAVAIFALIMIFALAYWQIEGKKFYTGPVDETVHGIEPVNESMVSADVGQETYQDNKQNHGRKMKPRS